MERYWVWEYGLFEKNPKRVDSLNPETTLEVVKLADAQAAVEALRRELLEWKRALCGLTPGGPEFANDHAYCAEWVRKARENQHDIIISKHRKLKATQAFLDAEREKVEKLEANQVEYEKCTDEQIVALNQGCLDYEKELSQLKALVRALPVVRIEFDGAYHEALLAQPEDEAVKKLLKYRATLDALTPAAKGGDGIRKLAQLTQDEKGRA